MLVRRALISSLIVGSVATLVACSKDDSGAATSPSASASVAASAVPLPAPLPATWHLLVDPTSNAHVEMQTKAQDIKGATTAAQGEFDVSPLDLASSRGAVQIDLASFTTQTFGNADDKTQTKEALAWLQVVVGGRTSEELRWASFAVRSVDGLSAADLTAVAPTKGGAGDDVRTVTMTLHGDLLIHAHKVAKDAVVFVAFHHPAGASPQTKPTRVDVTSKEPLLVALKDIDVGPRDISTGKSSPWTAAQKTKVATTASVTVALSAKPAP